MKLAGLLILASLLQSQPEELKIRSVQIQRYDVFDPAYREFDSWIFRILNGVHLKTSESFVRNELLFSSGDVYNPDIIRESERNLRKYAFLSDVSIQVENVSFPNVDILVHTEDQWTTKPILSFGKSRGARTLDAGIEEDNFLGMGRKVGIRYESGPERDGVTGIYSDPRFLNTRLRLTSAFSFLSDGHKVSVGFIQPFRSEITKWSYNVAMDDLRQLDHLYFQGTDAAALDHIRHTAALAVFRAWGQRYQKQRTGISFGYDESLYPDTLIFDEEAANENVVQQNLNPEERRVFTTGVHWERDWQNFWKTNYIDNFGRAEDLPIGIITSAAVSHSRNELGSDYETAAFSNRWASRPGDSLYFVSKASLLIRRQEGDWNNLIADFFAHFYRKSGKLNLGLVRSPRQTFAANLSGTLTRDVDAPFQLSLGEENGLRGYRFQNFVGTNRILANLEHRIFMPWESRILAFGIAPFADAGYVWDDNDRNWGASAGLGFRFAMKKFGRTRVFRLDIAYPLVHANGSGISVSFSTGQIFDVL